MHCYPECIAEVMRSIKVDSREADVKPPMGVAPLFNCLHYGLTPCGLVLRRLLWPTFYFVDGLGNGFI